MMLLPLLRPVGKVGAARLVLAGTSASSVELKDLQNEAPQVPTPVAPHPLVLGEDSGEQADNSFVRKGSSSSAKGDSSFVRKSSGSNWHAQAENAFVKKSSGSKPWEVAQQPQQQQHQPMMFHYPASASYWYPQGMMQAGAQFYRSQPQESSSAESAEAAEAGTEAAAENDGVAVRTSGACSSSSYPAGAVMMPIMWPVHGMTFGQNFAAWPLVQNPAQSSGASGDRGVGAVEHSTAGSASKPVAASASTAEASASSTEVGVSETSSSTAATTADSSSTATPTDQGSACSSGTSEPLAAADGSLFVPQCRTGASRRQRRRRRAMLPVGSVSSGAAQPDQVAEMRRLVEENLRAQGGYALPQDGWNQDEYMRGMQMFAPMTTGWEAPEMASLEELWQNNGLRVSWADASMEAGEPAQRLPTVCEVVATSGGSTSTRCESPAHFWPATPESTPPQSPRNRQAAVRSTVTTGDSSAPFNITAVAQVSAEAESDDGSFDHFVAQLSEGDEATKRQVLDWVARSVWPLASTPGGTRVVQKAIEVGDPSDRLAIVEQIRGHVQEAAASPHANHVLQKCVVEMPAEQVKFMLQELQGNAVAFARHRYGCRVLERLIEHCPKNDVQSILTEVLEGTEKLCRHAFGNFVVQHVLEHGSPSQRTQVADVLLTDVVRLAKHRVASHVVKAALVHCGQDDKERLIKALSADNAELSDLAHHHCGSFVVRELRRASAGRDAAK